MKNSLKKISKNTKGITLMALVITIVLLLILASISVYSGVNVVKSSRFTSFTAELKIMQTHVNEIYQKYTDGGSIDVGGNTYTGDEILNIGKDIAQVTDKANIAFTSAGSGITDRTGYKYFDQQTIKDLNIEGVEEEFFINIQKRSIISCEGFEYENKMYYTLDQIPSGFYNVEYEEEIGTLNFDINSERVNGKGKIHIYNISCDKYINKWQVRYRLKGDSTENWKIIEEFEGDKVDFVVEKLGTYEVQVFHNDEISSIVKEVELGLQIGDYVNYTYDVKDDKYSLPTTKSGYVVDQKI